jgi:hypothetical protein
MEYNMTIVTSVNDENEKGENEVLTVNFSL